MRIVLVNLPWRHNGRVGVRAGSRWPFTYTPEKDGRMPYIPFPFFLAYATSVLKKAGIETHLIDAIAEGAGEEETIEKINSLNPGLLVAETSTPSFASDLKILESIRNRLPEAKVALSGPHSSVFAAEIFEKNFFVDYVLVGEYEYTLRELVCNLRDGLPIEGVDGLAYRGDKGIKINKRRRLIDPLDSLPWPERDSLPMYSYNDGFCGLPQPNVQMWTSRGCPFVCSYCLWPQTMYQGGAYRKRMPAYVVDEMECLVKKFGFKAVYFDDDTFNIDRCHALKISSEIKKRKINVPWAAMARVDLMDKGLLKSMANAGLYAVKYGIESADQGILNFDRRQMELDSVGAIIRYTKNLGIKVHLTFCLGLPGETRETVGKTIKFINDVRPDSAQFSFATPFPGTDLFNYLKDRNLLLSEEWSDYDGNVQCVIRREQA